MSEQYYVDLQGKTAGPFNLEEMRGLYQGRSISDETLFSKPGADEWLPVSLISGLLRPSGGPPVVEFKPVTSPVTSQPPQRAVNKSDFICTACGVVGKPKLETKGSFAIEVVLWLFFLIPGLIYSIWRMTTRYRACPSCKSGALIPAGSPQGIRMLQSQ